MAGLFRVHLRFVSVKSPGSPRGLLRGSTPPHRCDWGTNENRGGTGPAWLLEPDWAPLSDPEPLAVYLTRALRPAWCPVYAAALDSELRDDLPETNDRVNSRYFAL
ncbi:hypothetical protein SKAU_G00253880 [Synaphobranchus kaupii]|uniref:Uncharacterized protein n=1 Tax=Synaphobranchus kaupii TaxID=118154 RepID=A0A9Q1IRW1_SYNKA|nr:hypothetical protein SKAU_G00253880 [Synaphobranchus kaupii]